MNRWMSHSFHNGHEGVLTWKQKRIVTLIWIFFLFQEAKYIFVITTKRDKRVRGFYNNCTLFFKRAKCITWISKVNHVYYILFQTVLNAHQIQGITPPTTPNCSKTGSVRLLAHLNPYFSSQSIIKINISALYIFASGTARAQYALASKM